jgi:hypothetical protein
VTPRTFVPNVAPLPRMRTWRSAVAVAPIVLPRTIPVRPMGATRISRRKPYSRSQTTETPAEERARQDALGDDARVDERDVVDARRERRARRWDALVGCQDEQVVGGP